MSTQTDYVESQLNIPLDYFVYTDGSCINNGKPNAKAGIGIFFDINDPRNISKRIKGKHTNNVDELTAIIETFPVIQKRSREWQTYIHN